jgi:replicative superfamily II helicase
MVFVHARMATVKTGMLLKEMAQNKGQTGLFEAEQSPQLGQAKGAMAKSRNRQMAELFNMGIGIHHAGMLRSDRNLVEKLFSQGLIKVGEICTNRDRSLNNLRTLTCSNGYLYMPCC